MDKPMIDKAAGDKNCKVFDSNFRVEVYMSEIKNYVMEKTYFDKDESFLMPV